MSGSVLFITAAIMEAVIFLLRLKRKAGHTRAECLVRAVLPCVYIPLFFTLHLTWGPQYYALAVYAGLSALAALLRMLPIKSRSRPLRLPGILLRASGRLALILLCALPILFFPEYTLPQPTGAYSVAVHYDTYTDLSRPEDFSATGENRRVNVTFWYPQDALETYPLAVFSPGGMSVGTSNEWLYNELASHGYVVCAIDHPYHSMYTTYVNGGTVYIDRGYTGELQGENALADRQQSFLYYQKWMGLRIADISFVLDHIVSHAASAPDDPVYRRIDPSKLAVMGHSLGGSAALGAGRVREDISAVIALDAPFLWDIQGVENGEFTFSQAPYPAPVLNIYSDSVFSLLSTRPQYAQNARLLAQNLESAPALRIPGTGHFSLTDLSLASPPLTRLLNGFAQTADPMACLDTINRACLAFLDLHLKGKGTFSPALFN